MQLMRCTGKLRKEMGVKDAALFQGPAPASGLGPWHANLIYIQRRKCVLFANDTTLFNFIVLDVLRKDIRELQQLFLRFLHPVLAEEGFGEVGRTAIAAEYEDLRVSKSSSKSVLGSLNDLAFHYEHEILSAGGVHSPQVPSIIKALNRMPMGALKYASPIEALQKVVYGGRHMSR